MRNTLAHHSHWRGAKQGSTEEGKEGSPSFGRLSYMFSVLNRSKLCFLPSPTLLLTRPPSCFQKGMSLLKKKKKKQDTREMEDMVGGWGRGEKKARSKRLSQFQFFPISQALVLGHRNRAHKSAPKSKNPLICPRWVDTNFIINNNESSPGKWAFSYLHKVKTLCPWFIFGVCIGGLSLCDHKRIQKHKKYNINAVITFMVYYYSEKKC